MLVAILNELHESFLLFSGSSQCDATHEFVLYR